MNLNITGKDFELTDSIKSYINEKVSKLTKYFLKLSEFTLTW